MLATGTNATMRSFMGVPLVVLGEVIGLLQVDSAEPAAFTDDDVYVLAGLGAQVAVEKRLAPLLSGVAEATGSPADVVIDCPGDLRVRTDPAVLVRVLGPVVDNAVRYAGHARVTARRDDRSVTVEVADDGPGIPEDLRERIFDRFVRGRHTIAGMGLGLAIARHLGVSIEAEIDHVPRETGACFVVGLPDLVAVTPPR